MSWENHEPIKRPCPCGKGHYAVVQRSDDWGRFDERWEMDCRACAAKHGLYTEVYNRKGMYETYRGWVLRSVLKELAVAEVKLERAEKRLTVDATKQLGKHWRAHFDGKAKKAIWSELTEDGKHYPSLGTFYTHVSDSGIDRVLNRYFDRRELPTIVRILGPGASDLMARIAEIEQLERALEEQRSQARQQAVN